MQALDRVPVVAILGPRQCGKSTLATAIADGFGGDRVLYLDLERPADLARLQDPEALLAAHADRLVCIDEVQRRPDLFGTLRYLVDRERRNGQFLVLGSASPDLIRQSSETLAGRIRYLELTPFLMEEIGAEPEVRSYWLRGGFPRSWLAPDDPESFRWRQDFVRDFLERDIPALKPRVAPPAVARLWEMLAHNHGQLLNAAALANALAVSAHTVRSYLDLLEGAFMVRRLPPFAGNLKKRLVKSPKLYLRDTGLLHALLRIEDWAGLLGHPVVGASWEALCLENIAARLHPACRISFYRTARGAESDLVIERGSVRVVVEFKASTSPHPLRGFWQALEDLGTERNWILSPVAQGFPVRNTRVASLTEFLDAPENRDLW